MIQLHLGRTRLENQIILEREHLVLMDMLGTVLVEIRAAKDIRTCQALANSLHNLPAMIISGFPANEIIESVLETAKRSGVAEYIEKLHVYSNDKVPDS